MKYEKPYIEWIEIKEDIITQSGDGLYNTGTEERDDRGDYGNIFQ